MKLFGEHFAEWHPPSTHDHHGVDAQRGCRTRAATDASRQQPTLTPFLDGQWHTAQWRSQQWAPQQCCPWCARRDPYSRRQKPGRAPVAGRAADRQRGGIPLPSPRQHLPRRLGGWEDNWPPRQRGLGDGACMARRQRLGHGTGQGQAALGADAAPAPTSPREVRSRRSMWDMEDSGVRQRATAELSIGARDTTHCHPMWWQLTKRQKCGGRHDAKETAAAAAAARRSSIRWGGAELAPSNAKQSETAADAAHRETVGDERCPPGACHT